MTLAFVQLAFDHAWAFERARMKQERAILERLLQVGWPPSGNPTILHAPADNSHPQQSTNS